ncbi:MAG: tetratricopeptide repeat protein [Planctomycetota bacterium]
MNLQFSTGLAIWSPSLPFNDEQTPARPAAGPEERSVARLLATILQRTQRRAHAIIPKAKLENGEEVWVIAGRAWTAEEAAGAPQIQGCSRVAWGHADLGDNCKLEMHVMDQPAKRIIWEGAFDRPKSDLVSLFVVMARTLDATILPVRPPVANEMWLQQMPTRNSECLWHLLTAIDFRESLDLGIQIPDSTEAFVSLKSALAADPKCAFAASLLMGAAVRWVSNKKGDPQPAMLALADAVSSRGDIPRFVAALAECELQLENYDSALKHAKEYLSKSAGGNDAAHSEELLGRIYEKTGDVTNASSAFRRAVQLDPKRIVSWHQLGFLAAQLNQWENAESCYMKCAELAPANTEIQEKLKLVREELVKVRERRGPLAPPGGHPAR